MSKAERILEQLVVAPGSRAGLADRDPGWTGAPGYEGLAHGELKHEARAILARDIERLSDAQELLWASDTRAVLVVFQAMDAAGKDSAIKHVMSGVNPQGVQVYSFKQPSSEELDHDFLWRIAKAAPERGRIGIFNRSHYEEVVALRVHASGVDLVRGVAATVPTDRRVGLGAGRELHAARIVHLPLLAGPRLAGLPYDTAGFVLADDDLTVDGDDAVFAIGDGTASPYKQGGLAAQQADAVAERIAHRAGAPGEPRPYAPALRALLRTENGPRYLRAEPPGGDGECLVSDQCLWWPPSKVASRWLTPWLAARDTSTSSAPPRVLPTGGISRGSIGAATVA
jgi:hypothetical protein